MSLPHFMSLNVYFFILIDCFIDGTIASSGPVVLLLVEFYPKFLSGVILKSVHMRGSFAVKNVYPLLINPFDIIPMPISSQLVRKSHIKFRIKLYE